MSNQNVGTPRFYIDYGQYWKSTGELGFAGANWVNQNYATESQVMNLIGLNPTNMTTFPVNEMSSWGVINYTTPYTSTEQWELNYFAVLGHNLNSAGVRFYVETYDSENAQFNTNMTEIINGDGSNNYPNMDSDGFTILSFERGANDNRYYAIRPVIAAPDNGGDINQTYTDDVQIGALSFGRYYDMPHAPDMNLTMSHEYDGLKTITSKGGATLSNALYYKPPMWGSREAWQLGDWKWLSSGRRVWNLSFSYISDSDLEPTNYTGLDENGEYIGGDNWFQSVLYYTKGGHLPFIFCPDPSVAYTYDDQTPEKAPTSIPEFAIARFDMDSFTRERVAINIYNMKIKVVESW